MRLNIIYDFIVRIRRNVKGNYCKRILFYIDFKEIGWDFWIIVSFGYEVYECRGVCNYFLVEYFIFIKYVIIQVLVYFKNFQKVFKVCCVFIKLEFIFIFYLDKGVVIYKFKYEGMVVFECGCRQKRSFVVYLIIVNVYILCFYLIRLFNKIMYRLQSFVILGNLIGQFVVGNVFLLCSLDFFNLFFFRFVIFR